MSVSRYQKMQTLHLIVLQHMKYIISGKENFKVQIEGGCTKALLG